MQPPREHPRKFGRARPQQRRDGGGRERGSPGRECAAGASPPPPAAGGAAGEPRVLPPMSLSAGRGGLPAVGPVQVPPFSPRFLITLLNLNGLFCGRYDRV